MVTIDVYLFV